MLDASVAVWSADDDCGIRLFEIARAYLLGQPRRRLGRFGKNHHAARRSVEPVQKPEIRLARLVVFFYKVLFERRQQIGIAALVALRRHVLRLDHNEQMIVLEKHRRLELAVVRCFRLGLCLRRSRSYHILDVQPELYLGRGLRGLLRLFAVGVVCLFSAASVPFGLAVAAAIVVASAVAFPLAAIVAVTSAVAFSLAAIAVVPVPVLIAAALALAEFLIAVIRLSSVFIAVTFFAVAAAIVAVTSAVAFSLAELFILIERLSLAVTIRLAALSVTVVGRLFAVAAVCYVVRHLHLHDPLQPHGSGTLLSVGRHTS